MEKILWVIFRGILYANGRWIVLLCIHVVICSMNRFLQYNGESDGGRLRSWQRILVLAVVMCVSLSAMFFSAWQAEAAVAGAITDLKVSGIGYDQITLKWGTPADGGSAITGYKIQQGSGTWTVIAGSGVSTTEHTVTGLTPGTSYTFKVRAVNSDGDAPESNTVTVIPNKFAHNIPDGLSLSDSNWFGKSAAFSPDGATLALGAPGDDTGSSNTGAVHLFTKNGDTWTHSTKIAHNSHGLTLTSLDYFGISTAFSSDGTTLAVGAWGDDTGGPRRGAVHLFTKNGDVWEHSTKIAHGTNELTLADVDHFGYSTAFSSDGTLAVGARYDDTGGGDRGAVHLFTKNGGTWTHSVKIDNSFAGLTLVDTDNFGSSVAFSSDGTLAVGALGDDTGGENRGAVHLFTKNGGTWTHSVKIDNSFAGLTLADVDNFGSSAAFSSDAALAVGALGDDTGGIGDNNRGAVYLFAKNGTQWAYHSKIAHDSNGLVLADTDNFGSSAALSSDGATLAVGAHYDDTGGDIRGAAYLFNLPDTVAPYITTQTFTNGTPANGKYPKTGDSLTFSFTFSETLPTAPTISIGGASATFTKTGDTYTATYTVPATTTEGPITYDIDTLTDSDSQSFNPPETNSPFTIDTTAPTLAAIADDPSGIDSHIGTTADTTPDFSFTSDEAGTIAYAGGCASSETIAVSGTNTVSFSTLAYAAYTNCAVTVTDEAGNISSSLAVPDFTIQQIPEAIDDLVVSGIGYDQITLGWTTPGDNGSAITEYEVQQDASGTWDDISGSDATTVSHTVTGLTPGTSYTFKVRAVNSNGNAPDSNTVTVIPNKFTDTIPDGLTLVDTDNFGYAAALSSDGATLAVGAQGDDTGGDSRGAVYLFTKTATTWTHSVTIDNNFTGLNLADNDSFGSSAALSSDGTTLAVGAQGDDTGGDSRGAVYLFTKTATTWTHSVTIDNNFTGLNLADSDRFGSAAALSLNGTTLVIGAQGDDSDGNDKGAVYLFTKTDTTWTHSVTIDNDFAGFNLPDYDQFGSSAAFSSDGATLAVGAWNSGDGDSRGAVYLFTKTGITWAHSVTIDNNFAGLILDESDAFGTSAAFSSDGGALAVGAYGDGGQDKGAVHLFTKNGTQWAYHSKITDGSHGLTLADNNWFGYSAALSSDDTLVVGAVRDDDKGAAYLLNLPDTVAPYIVTQTFTNSTPANGNDPKAGDSLTFSFTFSETLPTAPTITIEGASATFSESTGTYTATYLVTAATAKGPIVYNIGTLTDSAGQSFDPPETDSPFALTGFAETSYARYGVKDTALSHQMPVPGLSSASVSVSSYAFKTGSELPAGTGLTLSSAGLLSGTPNQTDVNESPMTLRLVATTSETPAVTYETDIVLTVAAEEYAATVTNANDGATDAGFTLTRNAVTGSGTVTCTGFTYRGTHPNGHFYLPEGGSDATCTVSTTGTFSFNRYDALRKWTWNPIKSDEAEVISTSVDVDVLLTGSATATADASDAVVHGVYTFDGSDQISATTQDTADHQYFENDDLLNGDTFGLQAVDDTEDEQDEAFLVSARAPLEDPSFAMYVYIEDNDPPVFESAPTNLSYTVSSPIIDVILPKTKGDSGSGVTYTLTASGGGGTGGFPSGLSFDSTNRTLSGTTGSTDETATMTYTATENAMTVTAIFTITISASLIAIDGPDATYATGQTVSATASSITDADETWEYQLIDGGTDCTGTTTGTFTTYTAGTALTYGTDASPDVTTDADDGKKVCFKLTDTKGTATDTTDDQIHYLASGILRLDNAAPTLTAITDGTSGGDTTIGGTLDATPELSFTLSGLRLSETATLLWTGECTAESNTITSQTDAATDETITVTLNSDTEESGDFMEGSTITGCTVKVTDEAGNASASLTIPSFTIVSPAPVFVNTVNAVTYRKGVAIATLTLPGLRPGTGHGNITFDLSGLPTGTGLTFTAPTTAAGTGSLTGNPNQADADGSPFTLTYTATDSAPSPIDPRVVTLTFGVTVTDFAVTVTDDADGSTPEREKELTVTVTDTNGVTNALWGMVDDIASCTASSNAQLTTAYTPSTSGTTITITDADANSKVACFRATYASNDYYGWSGVIGGIDRTDPVVGTVPLAGILTNTYLSSAEATNTDAIVGTPTVSDTSTYTTAYAVVSGSTTCNASVTYSATVPDATDVSGSDGTYKVCVRATDAATNVGYGGSQTFTKDTSVPTVSSVPLTGVLGDTYLNHAETTDTNAIVGTVSHSETGSPTIAYAVVSESTACEAGGFSYSSVAPDATAVSGSDGTYKICVSVADAATNVGYGESQTFTKDTTAPTLPDDGRHFTTTDFSPRSVSGSVAYLGAADHITATFVFSENISTDSFNVTTTVPGSNSAATLSFGRVASSDTSFVAAYVIRNGDTVNSGDSIDFAVPSTVRDVAGNPIVGTEERTVYTGTVTSAELIAGETAWGVVLTATPGYYPVGGSVTPATFTVDGTTYTLSELHYQISNDSLYLRITDENGNNVEEETVLAGYDVTLRKGTDTFTAAVNDASTTLSEYLRLSVDHEDAAEEALLTRIFTVGEEFTVSLSGPQPGDALIVSADADTEQYRVDTTPPSAPTIDLREADDTYGDIDHDNAYDATTDFGTNDDNITSNTNPYYTFGAVENTNGVTLTLLYAGASCAEHTVSGGDYTPDVQCTAAQSDGEHAVTATVTDLAGNVSPAAAALTVTIDTVDPPAMDIDLKSESDLGVSDTDNYTSSHDLTFTITGNTNSESLHAVLQKGATSQHNHPSAHADLSAPTGELTRNTGGTGNGENPVFKVLTHDLAGNTGLTATVDAETVYLDYVTAVPSFTFNSAFDSGAKNNDGITNSRQLGFSIGNIEVEAANRGNGAEVTVYDNSGTGSTKGAAVSLTDEIGHEHAPVTAETHTTETQQTDFADGKHGFFVCQTDDAGNTSCTTSALNWIVDTVAPDAPGRPDLKAEDDSYGANANGARDGTDSDDLTNKQSDLTVASFASGQGTHDDGAHDHHQIRFYKWTDANSDSAVDDGELAELKAPSGDITGSANIAQVSGYGIAALGTEKNLYSASETLGEGAHRFIAKQYDIAGNLSAVSDPLEMRVDVTAPNPVTVILALHPLSDTGTSQVDKQTSNISPIFRFISGSAQSDDVDYYEVWRARLTEGHTTPQGETYAYPSSSDTAEQTSYEYSASDSVVERTTELGATYGDNAYQNGALIEISSMTVPHFNSYYAFKVYTVDLAGNYAAGTDSETIRILVPPPKPEKMDLEGADDTARAALANGNSDNITSATSWTLSGLYKNNSDHERDPDSDGTDDADGGSAGGVAGVEIRIRRLDENNQETDRRTVSVTTTQSDGAISKPSNLATGDYTFSTEFDVLSAFGASAPDGTYVITVKAANGAGEEGQSSDPLTITLDRQAPVPDAYLVLRTQWFSDGVSGHRHHRFTVTDASNGEPNGMVMAYDGGSESSESIFILPGTSDSVDSDNWAMRSDYEGYEVVYVDAAGNATDREAFPDYLKAPLITSYEIDQAAHKYLVIAGAQNNRALEGFKQFTYNSSDCDPNRAGITKTPYTPASVLTLPSDTVCVEATDGYGNTASILVRALAQPLIANFTLNEDGNEPDRSPTDFITNNTTLRLQGTTLPGSTARLLVKESAQSWGDPSDPNDNFEGTELAIPTERINADTGAFEVTYEIPADYHGGTYTFETRGYVTNIETLGATEIGPITLRDTVYDAEAPAKPPQAPYLDASDDTGVSGDSITATTQDLTIHVVGEEAAEMTLSTGQKEINAEQNGANTIDIPRLTEGTHTITVTATDKAGNTSPPSDPFTLTIDPTAPEVTIVRLNDEDTTIDTDTRFITVANDETTVAFRVAAIAESDCETATWTTTGSAYTSPEQFNPNTAFSAVTNGACFIARDAAYNIATKHSDDAIEGVGDARITGATKEGTTFYTKSGQRELTGVTASGAKVLIKITADEPTAFTGTQLRDTGFANHTFDMDAAATTFAEVITIPSGADGQKLIAWIWTDKDDKTTATPAITLGALTVDDTPATVTATAARTSNSSGTTAKQHDTLFLDITVNEIMQSATVTLAGITATEADCAVPSTADTLFTCSVTLSNEAHEGAARAEWTLTDRAGNETTGTLTAEIIIDATAPAVTVTSSRGMLISANDVLTLNLSVTDTNGITAGTYAFSATGGTLATCEVTATAGQKSAATSCALTVTATGDGAPVTLTIPRLTDTPGNEKPQHTRVIARVDTTAPTLSAITDQDSAKKKKFSFTLEAAHNQHTSSRDIPETLTPLFGGDCEDFKTNAKFTAQTPDTETQTYTATATAPKGTYEACAITLRDEAGNESAALTFTEFTVKGGGGIGRIGGALFGKIQSFFSGGNRDTTSVFNPTPPSAQQQTPPQTPAPSAKIVPVALPARVTATYSLGDTHKHVRAAQILLNQTSCPVTSSGPGSPGRETTYFGSLTQRAITCFQRARRLPEDGTLTPRLYAALLSAARAGAAAPPARQTPTPEQRTPTSAPQLAPTPVQPIAETPGVTVPDRVAATYILGDTHEHIRAAQILLNKTSCPVASSGPGSPGRETAYFGSLTERAITCLQRTQGRPEDGILTPRLYTALHSAVYPAAARQQAPTVDNTPPTTPPADTDQQEDRRAVEQPAETPVEDNSAVYQPITQPYTIKRRSFEAPSL